MALARNNYTYEYYYHHCLWPFGDQVQCGYYNISRDNEAEFMSPKQNPFTWIGSAGVFCPIKQNNNKQKFTFQLLY